MKSKYKGTGGQKTSKWLKVYCVNKMRIIIIKKPVTRDKPNRKGVRLRGREGERGINCTVFIFICMHLTCYLIQRRM